MRHNLFFILFILAFLPHISEAPIWVSVAVVVIATHAYFALAGFLPRMTLRISGVLSVLAGLVVYLQFKTLLGPESATALLLILAALKLEELRTERDGVIFLFLLTLLVMYYLLFSQSLLATLYMAFMCLAILLGFVIAHTPREHLQGVLLASPKLVSKDLLLTLPIFLMLFTFFPRFSMPWAYKMMSDTNPVGFSERLSPGEMATLARSQEPAFRALFSKGERLSSGLLYWRGLVLTETDGWGWWSSESKHQPTKKINLAANPKNNIQQSTDKSRAQSNFSYEVHLEPKYNKRLFVLDKTEKIFWSDSKNFNPIIKTSTQTFLTQFSILSRVGYMGVMANEEPVAPAEDIASSIQAGLQISKPSARMQVFIDELKSKFRSDRELAEGVLNHFRTAGFQYSLTTPEMKTVDEFIFDKKIGFCEHYASSFAAILRWAGVPARVVSGFQGGRYNEYTDFLLVRDQDAHSWTEVYLENTWQRIDPTFSVNPTRITTGDIALALPGEVSGNGTDFFGRSLSQIQMAYAALEHRYNQFILNYNSDAQEQLLNLSLGSKQKRWLLLGISILSIFIFLFLLRFVLYRRVEKDHFHYLLEGIQRDLMAQKVRVMPQDSITRLMQKAKQRWPDHSTQFDSIEKKYHAYRFKVVAQAQLKNTAINSGQKIQQSSLNDFVVQSKNSKLQAQQISKDWSFILANIQRQHSI